MSPRSPLRLGLVGAGGIARSYIEVFSGFDEAVVEAVAEPREEARVAAAAALGCAGFADHESLADRADVDAVLICTPPSSHVDITSHFVRRGLPVLCEKPFALRPEDARGLLTEAAELGVLVTMASKFRHVEDVNQAKRIVGSGVIGETVLFENTFASRVPMAERWNSDPEIAGGGVLVDNGTHSADIARYLLGPIVEVSAVEGKRIQQLAVEDTAQMFLRSADGAMGNVDLSWSVDRAIDAYIGLYGPDGIVEVGWKTSRYCKATERDWVTFGTGYDKTAAMGAQVRNFCRAVRGDEPLAVSADDAVASVEVIAGAYRSLGSERWVAVPEIPIEPFRRAEESEHRDAVA